MVMPIALHVTYVVEIEPFFDEYATRQSSLSRLFEAKDG
jgi:hypothetical protein